MRFGTRSCWQRVARVVMLTAVVAFVLQATFIAMSEAATGDTTHYYQGFVLRHLFGDGSHHSHVVAHVHADGTMHQHAIDDGTLDDHVKERGYNMAIVTGLVPFPTTCAITTPAGHKLVPDPAQALKVTEPDGLRKPPRTPGIA